MHRRALLAGAAGALTGVTAGCLSATPVVASVTRTETRTVAVDPGTPVAVHDPHGEVTVRPADGDEVAFEIEFEGPSEDAIDASAVTIEEADGVLRFEADHEETSFLWEDVTISPTVRLPDGVPLAEVDAENADVDVRGVAGDATIETTNGTVTARDLDGTVSLSTTNGAVEAAGIERLRRAESTNGAVTVEVPAIAERATIATTNGAVEAALSPDLDARVEVSATNGSVDVADLEFDDATADDDEFAGTLGDGSRELSIETTNGSVEVGRLP